MLLTILKIVFTISLIIIGYIFSRIIYRKFNFLLEYRNHNESSDIKISVIIPSRNEQDNLPIILDSILNQDYKNIEVIVVDDNSSDNTFDVASSYGVNVLSIKNKPSEWKGKTWACQKGAEISKGDFLLFIDADVYFKKDAISNIVKKYAKEQKVISIIPYHNTGSFSCAIHAAQTFSDFNFENNYYVLTKEAIEKWENNKLTLLKAREAVRSLKSLARKCKDKSKKELIKAFEHVLLTIVAIRHAYLASLCAVKSIYYNNINNDYIFEIEKERAWQLQVIE